jgi:hypothetical protein
MFEYHGMKVKTRKETKKYKHCCNNLSWHIDYAVLCVSSVDFNSP